MFLYSLSSGPNPTLWGETPMARGTFRTRGTRLLLPMRSRCVANFIARIITIVRFQVLNLALWKTPMRAGNVSIPDKLNIYFRFNLFPTTIRVVRIRPFWKNSQGTGRFLLPVGSLCVAIFIARIIRVIQFPVLNLALWESPTGVARD